MPGARNRGSDMALISGETAAPPEPRQASADTRRILVARGLRAFGDGFVALLVPIYLLELGFCALAIGGIVTSTLIGTALLALWAGMLANSQSARPLLHAPALSMAATAAAFAATPASRPRLWIGGAGRDGFLRYRLPGPVAAGVVAFRGVSDLGHGRRGDPVLERDLLGRLLPRRGADRRAHRADQHDGVHPPAVKHPAGPRAVRARSADRDRAALGAQRPVANGCADPQFLRHGGRRARGPPGPPAPAPGAASP